MALSGQRALSFDSSVVVLYSFYLAQKTKDHWSLLSDLSFKRAMRPTLGSGGGGVKQKGGRGFSGPNACWILTWMRWITKFTKLIRLTIRPWKNIVKINDPFEIVDRGTPILYNNDLSSMATNQYPTGRNFGLLTKSWPECQPITNQLFLRK